MDSDLNSHVPAIYVAKYNRFVDNILGRINKILKTNYDPVTVKLTNPSPSTKSSKNKSTKKKKTTKKSKNGSKKSVSGTPTEATDKSTMVSTTSPTPKDVAETSKSTTTIAATEYISNAVPETVTTPRALASITVQEPESRNAASSTTKKLKRKSTKSKNKTKSMITTSGSSNSKKNQTNVKKQSKPRARATLYGLSSLKRSGDVSVNMMSDHTTIKTKFSLGPLILKVEKEFGRSTKRELRSATATTAEMSGKLSLRVVHGGAATLHSIRVLQPKQVRVESADDHDRTREFVWKRSSHIAHLVSQKLSSATRSMLRPPPIPIATAA